MSFPCGLQAVGLLEKDVHNEVLWTWVYPCLSTQQRDLILRKCSLTWDSVVPLVYTQHDRRWYYVCTESVQLDSLPKVTGVSLVLVTSDFQPEKYSCLCRVLLKQFKNTVSPVVMLESYLTAMTRGTCGVDENGTFNAIEYDIRHAYANSRVIDVVQMFGVEFIIIFTALLLKKRIVVYHPDVSVLATVCRSLPAFVWHRQNWHIVFPLVHLTSTELADLRSVGAYIAGFMDSAVDSHSDLYDVFVNAYTKEVSIATHAKDSLSLGKLHKDLATFLTQCVCETGKTDEECIKEISVKTKELVNNLRGLSTEDIGGKPVLTLETLRAKQLPATTENFLYGLAAAEGLLKM